MSSISIFSNFKLVEHTTLCEHIQELHFFVHDYNELVQVLTNYNYDYVPDNILLNAHYKSSKIAEEVLITEKGNPIITSDNTVVNYNDLSFVINQYCQNNSAIEVIDQGHYCESCFEKVHGEWSLGNVINVLKSSPKLPTSKKIQYILLSHKRPMTSTEIYSSGMPWDISGSTPKNTVCARCSTLALNGVIKRSNNVYFI